jgi:hypothetical protein
VPTARSARTARREAETIAGRAGLIARGVLYCIAAVLAARLVAGNDEHVDREDALHRVVEQPFGKALLGSLAVGFAGYAIWRLLRAWRGDKVPKRLADAGRAAIYVVLFLAAVRILFDKPASSGGDRPEKEWTARLLDVTGGSVVVALAGAAVFVVGAVLVWRGVRTTFDDRLRLDAMSRWERRWLPRIGIAGYTARGVVFALIGFVLTRAALTYDPEEAVGVDGALHRLLEHAAGRAVVLLVALGLLAFGLFSFVEARWRAEFPDAN